jgi:hypothetical protein
MLWAKVNPEDAFGHSHANGYRAYLVRLWQDGPQADWRASAQSARTGDTVRFADVDALFAFLLRQTQQTQLDDRTDADDAT